MSLGAQLVLIMFAAFTFGLVLLCTHLLDRCARLRAERDRAEFDNAALRRLICQRNEPPPPTGGEIL